MATWTASVQFDGFAYTTDPNGPPPSRVGTIVEWRVGLEAICLPTTDSLPQFNATPDDGNFYFSVGFQDDTNFPIASPGAFQLVAMRFGSASTEPPTWSTTFITPGFGGASPALLTAGGTLTITKDTTAGTITFTGPLGTETVTLAAIDALPGGPFGYDNNTPLRPRGVAHRMAIPDPTFADPAFNTDDIVQWYNLIGQLNGVTYQSVALSTGDPGTWWPTLANAFDPVSGSQTASLTPWWAYTQLAAREKVEAQVLAASLPIYRIFDSWKRLRNPSDLSIDMERSTEHGVLYRAGPAQAMPSQMDFERSFDNGHTWSSPVAVASNGAWMNASPSLNSVDGRLYLCWHNGTNILESRSLDGGANWSMPVTIPFTGTNPRRIANKSGGGSYYFYVDGSGNIKVAITYDNGASFRGPYTVVSSVGAQQLDAEFAPDSSIVVSYIDGGVWKQVRSRDMGQSWL